MKEPPGASERRDYQHQAASEGKRTNMLITVRRALLSAAGAAVIASTPALAQVDMTAVPDSLIECSKIEDVMARVACYDRNIRPAAGPAEEAPRPSEKSPPPAPIRATGAAVAESQAAPSPPPRPQTQPQPQPQPQSQRKTEPRPQPPAGTTRTLLEVAEVVERGPGAYLLTMQDGAQWEFAEDMSLDYHPPRPGSTVEIERGAFGSHRMRFDGQQPVRVRRLR